MEELGKDAGVTVFTAYHAACRPEVEAARRTLEHKDIRSINIVYREDVLHYCDPNGWIFDPRIAGGGVLMSSGINPISIVYAAAPSIDDLQVTNVQLHTPDNFQVESSGVVEFTFGSGHGRLDMDWFHKGSETRRIEFETTDGVYVLDIVRGVLTLEGKVLFGADKDRQTVDQNIEYRGVYQKFQELIKTHSSFVSYRDLAFILDAYDQ